MSDVRAVCFFTGDCDVLLSFSTERERSLTYQLAAVVQSPKLTIVFCSNVKRIRVMCAPYSENATLDTMCLMFSQNNVTKLANWCIHAEILSHQTTLKETKRVFKVLFSNQIVTNLLFMTPDQATSEHFLVGLLFTNRDISNHLTYYFIVCFCCIDVITLLKTKRKSGVHSNR